MRHFLPIFSFLFILCACQSETSVPGKIEIDSLPKASGTVGEVMVVMPNVLWKGTLGDRFRAIFESEKFGLPQDEPHFDLAQIPPESFTSIIKRHRTVINVQLGEAYPEAGVKTESNTHARGQFIVTIFGKDTKTISDLLEREGNELINSINKLERTRLVGDYKRVGDPVLSKKLMEKYNASFTFQKGFEVAVEEEDFVWTRLEKTRIKDGYRHFINIEIFLQSIPFLDDTQLSIDSLKAYRDSITKKHIQGSPEGAYMAISYKLFGPEAQFIDFNGEQAMEMRGLWRMEGGFMGGPFITLLLKDEKRNRLIMADAFVFAPEFDKREYLREAEAMLYSLEIAP